jgi:hypothetical protein
MITASSKELTCHVKRDVVTEEKRYNFSSCVNANGMWGSKVKIMVRTVVGHASTRPISATMESTNSMIMEINDERVLFLQFHFQGT